MGLTQDQLDEAAWCAVTMFGAPVRMFYLETFKKNAGAEKNESGKCC